MPLIPAIRDYLLSELERRGILRRLTVVSIHEKLDAWVLQCENEDRNIVSVVEDRLACGKIAIPGEVKDPDGFDGVDNVTGYLNTFGVTVAQRIRKQFEPLFDPASDPLSQEVLDINDFVREHAGYPLYDAQLAVAEAVRRQLQKDKCAFIVTECGSGKSKIGSVAMLSALWSVRHTRRKTFNVILCPSHEQTQKVLQSVLKSDRRVAQKILSAYLNPLTVYPDQPYDHPPILHPITGNPIVEPPSVGDFDTLGEKETAVLEVVQRKIAAGEHVLIYTSWVRSDSQRKLHKLLTDSGIRAEIMSEKVRPDEREDWVQRRLAAGMQVMIANPSLVETGCASVRTLYFV